ncbi:MAG: superoxide dismutase [Rickettsiaceae bacterium]|nr:superoxide dismutase [Rickettsiaceae bacterium]
MFSNSANQVKIPFILPELPYSKDAFAPYLSAESFDYHYSKHHNSYVNNLNKLIADKKELAKASLEDIIIASSQSNSMKAIFNNAAQIWNHSFFWHSITPDANKRNIDERLLYAIIRDFGSFEKFNKEFIEKGVSQFGSGWVWLVLTPTKLEIITTSNAENPFVSGSQPLIVCDLWEHAYYIDYRNNRANFLQMFLDNLVNWEFALENYLKNSFNP